MVDACMGWDKWESAGGAVRIGHCLGVEGPLSRVRDGQDERPCVPACRNSSRVGPADQKQTVRCAAFHRPLRRVRNRAVSGLCVRDCVEAKTPFDAVGSILAVHREQFCHS